MISHFQVENIAKSYNYSAFDKDLSPKIYFQKGLAFAVMNKSQTFH